MHIALVVFALASLCMPLLRRRTPALMFGVGALVCLGVAGWLVTLAPGILAGTPYVESAAWVPQIGLELSVHIDALSLILALIVTVVGALVLGYCATYFSPNEPGLGRFAGVLLAFAGVMLGLVTADNLYLMYVFWEATSVLSFLLIGHYTGRIAARGAALQALMVTTLGGLAMLVGLVLLHLETGTAAFSEVVANLTPTAGVTVACTLVIVGAATKSAQMPFHFWLPGAMAAPTPVSAYLHAASMVKAGIYLVLRLAPGGADVPGFRETLIVLGVATMLIGGWRALRQYDLKLVLAFGTVSQLGFMMVAAGFATRDTALGAVALVLAHAMFKAALFLAVGIIDHRAGTRDLRKLSGLVRTMPALAVVATLAAASMAGLPPLWGFVAKEAVFGGFLTAMETGDAWGTVALVGTAVGSALTVGYTARFLHGAFASKRDVAPTPLAQVSPFGAALELFAPATLVAATVVAPIAFIPVLDAAIARVADALPHTGEPAHLALWHGWNAALAVSALTVLAGLGLFAAREAVGKLQAAVPAWIDSSRAYWATLRGLDRLASRFTAGTQRGSLPGYLLWIFIVMIVSTAVMLPRIDVAELNIEPRMPWTSVVILVLMVVAALATAISAKRFQSMVLVGVTGYGMAGVFALSGAPDLATTQALIETFSVIVFVLVLRRLPARHAVGLATNLPKWLRALIGAFVGLSAAIAVLIATGTRNAPSDGLAFPELAPAGGHGDNFVNVTLVDIRGWDTMGELLVLVAAATGIASLVYLSSRRSRRERDLAREQLSAKQLRLAREKTRREWLLAGHHLAPDQRSIVVEVVIRLIFHALMITSAFLLFSGHNAPGGGFAGGVVAGLALAARYLAGGPRELEIAVRIDAGRLLGIGMVLVGLSVITPMCFGAPPFTSFWIDESVPLLGQVVFVTSTVFDIGVYLVVLGLAIDILSTLGAELDERAEEDDLYDTDMSAVVLDEGELRYGQPERQPVTRSIQLVRGRRRAKRGRRR